VDYPTTGPDMPDYEPRGCPPRPPPPRAPPPPPSRIGRLRSSVRVNTTGV